MSTGETRSGILVSLDQRLGPQVLLLKDVSIRHMRVILQLVKDQSRSFPRDHGGYSVLLSALTAEASSPQSHSSGGISFTSVDMDGSSAFFDKPSGSETSKLLLSNASFSSWPRRQNWVCSTCVLICC